MEGLFGYPETEGSETPMRSKKQIVDQRQSILLEIQNSLTEPSMVESTPMITALQLKNHKNLQIQQKKKLSRIALDNNFSPIVFKVLFSKNRLRASWIGIFFYSNQIFYILKSFFKLLSYF